MVGHSNAVDIARTDQDKAVDGDIFRISPVAHSDSRGDSHREGEGSRIGRNRAEVAVVGSSYSSFAGLLPRRGFQLYNCLYLSGACCNYLIASLSRICTYASPGDASEGRCDRKVG